MGTDAEERKWKKQTWEGEKERERIKKKKHELAVRGMRDFEEAKRGAV